MLPSREGTSVRRQARGGLGLTLLVPSTERGKQGGREGTQ